MCSSVFMITSENKTYVAYRISYIIYVPNINEKVIIFYMLQLNFHGEERERRGKDFSLSKVRLRIYVVAIHRIFAHKIDC